MGKAQSKQDQYESTRRREGKIRIAVAGNACVGKSTFINTFRGIDDGDEGAAETGIFQRTFAPESYSYPGNPNIILVDLPGIGTPTYPDVNTYCKKVGLETYDMFLILIAARFTQLDHGLVKKIKTMGKTSFFIWTKIDLDESHEKRKRRPDIEGMVKTIRANCYEDVKALGIRRDEIFLISNRHEKKWDFERLVLAILEKLPGRQKEEFTLSLSLDHLSKDIVRKKLREDRTVLTEEYPVDSKAYNKENHDYEFATFLKKKLGGWKNAKIQFGITGDSGTGKSAFINAIRGLKDDDDGAAKVDVIETTRVPTEYQHPDNPKICFVDLPGIGTPSYPDISTYCKQVNLENYDRYLIFTASRFTEYDLKLAKKVKSIGKSFFLVRTKIDDDIRAESIKRTFNEKEMLEKIKTCCFENVKDFISSEKHIFLISNYDKGKWDFCRLVEAISDVTDCSF